MMLDLRFSWSWLWRVRSFGCNAVYCWEIPTFRSNVSPLSSWPESKLSRKQAEADDKLSETLAENTAWWKLKPERRRYVPPKHSWLHGSHKPLIWFLRPKYMYFLSPLLSGSVYIPRSSTISIYVFLISIALVFGLHTTLIYHFLGFIVPIFGKEYKLWNLSLFYFSFLLFLCYAQIFFSILCCNIVPSVFFRCLPTFHFN
jgi:hypothetical protein